MPDPIRTAPRPSPSPHVVETQPTPTTTQVARETSLDDAVADIDRARAARTSPRSRVERTGVVPLTPNEPTARQPGEITLHVRAFHPRPQFAGHFRGEDRGFSTEEDSRAKVRAAVLVDTTASAPRATQVGGRCDESANPLLEAVFGLAARPRTAIPTVSARSNAAGPQTTRVRLNAAAALPFTPRAITPDVDVRADVVVRREEGPRLRIHARVEGNGFPCAESFVRDHEGNAVFLGVHAIRNRQSPYTHLFGEGDTRMMEVDLAIITDESGRFLAVEYGGRRHSLHEWNQQFENAAPEVGVSLLDPAQDAAHPAPVLAPPREPQP